MSIILSDKEKIKRGTLDNRTSRAARETSRMDNVFAFPILKKIPKPGIPLKDKGIATFKFWCEKLLDAGLLTSITVEEVQNLALIDDMITERILAGKSPSIRSIEIRRQHLLKLESLNVDRAVYTDVKSKSAFSHCGFSNRLRSIADHKAVRYDD